jgi:hypothetical protein
MVKSWKDPISIISWGQILAACGIGAVFYDVESATDDFEDIVALPLKHGPKSGLDTKRIGIIGFSGNGRISIKLASRY